MCDCEHFSYTSQPNDDIYIDTNVASLGTRENGTTKKTYQTLGPKHCKRLEMTFLCKLYVYDVYVYVQ